MPFAQIFTFALGAALNFSKMFYVRHNRKLVLLHFLLFWSEVFSERLNWIPPPPPQKKVSNHLSGKNIPLLSRSEIQEKEAEISTIIGLLARADIRLYF